MKISEKQIRKIIREALEEIPTAEELDKVLMFKTKKYIYVSGGELYINKSRSSAQRFKQLRSDLQNYLQKH